MSTRSLAGLVRHDGVLATYAHAALVVAASHIPVAAVAVVHVASVHVAVVVMIHGRDWALRWSVGRSYDQKR